MRKKSLLALAILAAAALTAAGSAFSHTQLDADAQGRRRAGLHDQADQGRQEGHVAQGRHVQVRDQRQARRIHNFTVEREKPSKPKIEKHLTGTGFMGTKTVTMKLKTGSWSFYCSNHEAQMHGDFKVTK